MSEKDRGEGKREAKAPDAECCGGMCREMMSHGMPDCCGMDVREVMSRFFAPKKTEEGAAR